MDAALHVLRYLRGTYDQAILYQHVDELADTLWGWVDSDWAADVDSRRSHTGYIIMLNTTEALPLGNLAVRTACPSLPLKPNM